MRWRPVASTSGPLLTDRAAGRQPGRAVRVGVRRRAVLPTAAACHRSHPQVPLETLRGELQSHVTALKNRLVEVSAAMSGHCLGGGGGCGVQSHVTALKNRLVEVSAPVKQWLSLQSLEGRVLFLHPALHPPPFCNTPGEPSCQITPWQVVNEDYNDFVSLSTKLVNVDGAVLRMQRPLLELKVSSKFGICFGFLMAGWR